MTSRLVAGPRSLCTPLLLLLPLLFLGPSEAAAIIVQVDLWVSKSNSNDTVVPGQTLEYSIYVSNSGPDAATGAAVNDTFPAELVNVDLVNIITNGGASSTLTAGPLMGVLNDTVDLPVGGTVVYIVAADVAGSATGTVSNTATVTPAAGYDDTDTDNNSSTDEDTVLTDLDFGDAPDPDYPTLLASNGAHHGILAGFHLGAAIDAETDGQPTAQADGDDNDGGDDDDGVTFTSGLRLNVVATTATLDVVASDAGNLWAWVDFDADSDWEDGVEKVFDEEALAEGVNSLSFSVPPEAELGTTFARFRFASDGPVSPLSAVSDGEVEDYQVRITPDDDLDLFNMDLTTDRTYYACNSITAGGDLAVFPDLSILAPAAITFHAYSLVVFKNGAYVEEGASLTVALGSVPGCD